MIYLYTTNIIIIALLVVKGFTWPTHLPTIPTQIPQKRFENPTVKPAPNSIKPEKYNQTLKGTIQNRGTLESTSNDNFAYSLLS